MRILLSAIIVPALCSTTNTVPSNTTTIAPVSTSTWIDSSVTTSTARTGFRTTTIAPVSTSTWIDSSVNTSTTRIANGNAAANGAAAATSTTQTPTTHGPFEGFPDGVTGYQMLFDEEPEEGDFLMNGFRYRLTFN